MADENEDGDQLDDSRKPGLLFSTLKFHLTALCPTKDHFRQLIEVNGGKLYQTDTYADIIISDHLRSKGNVERALSYKWIEECVERGEVLDPHEFLISNMIVKENGRPKNSAKTVKAKIVAAGPHPGRPGRTEFTKEDDDILLWWIEKATAKGGNTVYMALEDAFGRHSWHGWRNRWTKILRTREEKFRQISKGFDITTVYGWHSGIIRPGDTRSASPLPKQEKEKTSPKKGKWKKLALKEKHIRALQENLATLATTTDDEVRDQIFMDLANEYPERSAEDFRDFFEQALLQEYIETQRASEAKKAKKKAAKKETERLEFSIMEQRALFDKFDSLLWAEDDGERIVICRELAEEFEDHSAVDFLNFYRKKLMPTVRKIKSKGKVDDNQLENAVLAALNPESGRSSVDASDKRADVRFEKLDGSEEAPSQETTKASEGDAKRTIQTGSPSSSTLKQQSTSGIGSNPSRSNDGKATSPKGQPVMVYSPKYNNLSPLSSHKSPSPRQPPTPGTGKSSRSIASETTTLRMPPKSATASPIERATKSLIEMVEDAIGPEPLWPAVNVQSASSPAGEKSPALPIRQSATKESHKSPGLTVPPSSPPLMSSSSYVVESDPIPFKKPTTLPASSTKKVTQTPASAHTKRRRLDNEDRIQMIVESTPESKLFPNRFTSSISPSPSQQLKAESGQTDLGSSPLASRSLKRKQIDSARVQAASMRIIEEDPEYQDDEEDDDDNDDDIVMFMGSDEGTPRARGKQLATPESEADEVGSNDDKPIFLTDLDEDDDIGPDPIGTPEEEDVMKDFVEELMDLYSVDLQAIGMVVDATCNDPKLVHLICGELTKHKNKGGSDEDFVWPAKPGIWTEEDDNMLKEGSSEEDLVHLTEKHGKDRVYQRWAWLEESINAENQVESGSEDESLEDF